MSLRIRCNLQRASGFSLRADLDLPAAGVTAVVGESGSGKSTLLRVVAGLERAPGAEVSLGDARWQNAAVWVPPHRRALAMVQQDGGLFPHLSVLGNLRLPRRRSGFHLSLDDVVERLGLAQLLDRRVDALSGGQRQRVALARALLTPADLWLLDEPLSALDPPGRRALAPALADLFREFKQPVLYVTHALQEVLQVADHLVVLEDGAVIAVGTPNEVGQQLDHAVSREIDVGSILDCTFAGYDAKHNLSRLALGAEELWVRGDLSALAPRVRLQIPASAISLALSAGTETSVLNQLAARVLDLSMDRSGGALVTLSSADHTLYARVTSLSAERLRLAPGTPVFALIKSVALDARAL